MNVPGPDDSTFWTTVGAIVGLVFIGIGTSIWKFLKDRAGEAAGKQIVLDRASIADIRPFTELGVDMKSLLAEQRQQTSDTKAIRELLERQDEEREDNDKMRQAIKEALAEQKRPTTRPRVRRKP